MAVKVQEYRILVSLVPRQTHTVKKYSSGLFLIDHPAHDEWYFKGLDEVKKYFKVNGFPMARVVHG